MIEADVRQVTENPCRPERKKVLALTQVNAASRHKILSKRPPEPYINLGGSWKITGFNITEEKIPYNTTFGDPEITSKQAKYSRLVASISIRRTAIVGFFKLSAGVYAAIALTILSLLVVKDPSSQLGTLIGTLFAALVSFQAVGGELGSKEVVTLIDFIHIVAIFYIFLAAVITVYSQRFHKADKGDRLHHIMRRVFCPILAILFIIINVVVISYAAVVG